MIFFETSNEFSLQGRYERESKPGMFAAEIRREKVIWPDGDRHTYCIGTIEERMYLYYDGEVFHAKIEKTLSGKPKLIWCDGDIWTKQSSGRRPHFFAHGEKFKNLCS